MEDNSIKRTNLALGLVMLSHYVAYALVAACIVLSRLYTFLMICLTHSNLSAYYPIIASYVDYMAAEISYIGSTGMSYLEYPECFVGFVYFTFVVMALNAGLFGFIRLRRFIRNRTRPKPKPIPMPEPTIAIEIGSSRV